MTISISKSSHKKNKIISYSHTSFSVIERKLLVVAGMGQLVESSLVFCYDIKISKKTLVWYFVKGNLSINMRLFVRNSPGAICVLSKVLKILCSSPV